MNKTPAKFYWQANTSSGGTLRLNLELDGKFSLGDKKTALAGALSECYKFMRNKGYIPFDARLLSSRDIAQEFGKSRQYWEKLLNEGKIHYKETSAGRITTNLWVQGYLNDRERVNKYVIDVRDIFETIDATKRTSGRVACSVCDKDNFEFHVNSDANINGICRACGFHIHTTK